MAPVASQFTVARLREELTKLPDDAAVVLADDAGHWTPLTRVRAGLMQYAAGPRDRVRYEQIEVTLS